MKDNDRVLMIPETKRKLEELLRRKRAEKNQIVEEKNDAVGSQGDTHDNAAYEESMRRLEMAVSSVTNLQSQLERAQLIEPNPDNTAIGIGHRVTVSIKEERTEYTILGPLDSDPENGRISFKSPVGQALLNHRVSDTVRIKTPDGIVKARIITFAPGEFE